MRDNRNVNIGIIRHYKIIRKLYDKNHYEFLLYKLVIIKIKPIQ